MTYFRPGAARSPRLNVAITVSCIALSSGVTAPRLLAQTITPRTVPVQMSQQFDILPSDRSGMGGVMIALDDTLLDPFVNPAKARRVRGGVLSVSPFFHDVSGNGGGGRTLPISGVGSFGRWAAGGVFAIQQLDRAQLTGNVPLSERTASNRYVMGILARDFGHGLSVGGSAYFADLGAEDGIDRLYSGSDRNQQVGSAADVRLGLTKEWSGHRVFEAMVLRSRFDMTHDVHYPAFVQWTRLNTRIDMPERFEQNRDHTSTWGAHAEYSLPLGTDGWRLGWLGTVNWLSHPKIPDYRIFEVFTVPRDPGHTWAYNAGVGVSRTMGNTTLGVDVVMEPMYSTTWAEAAHDTMTVRGATIPKGAHTVDNEFRFSNSRIRFGFGHMAPARDSAMTFGFQFGLDVYSIRYRLGQTDLVRDQSRVQNEHWMEWTPTLGLRLRGSGFDLRYAFSLTCGAGGECVPCALGCGDDVSVAAPSPGGVIAAPTAPLRLEGGRVVTHRFTVSLKPR